MFFFLANTDSRIDKSKSHLKHFAEEGKIKSGARISIKDWGEYCKKGVAVIYIRKLYEGKTINTQLF